MCLMIACFVVISAMGGCEIVFMYSRKAFTKLSTLFIEAQPRRLKHNLTH